MQKNKIGVTAINKSEHLIESVEELNERIKPINEWFKTETEKRVRIALTSKGENKTCPFCGKQLKDRESTNGYPLTRAMVCCDCDKRYVIPMRLVGLNEIEALQMSQGFIQGEMLIEFRKKFRRVYDSNTDVV